MAATAAPLASTAPPSPMMDINETGALRDSPSPSPAGAGDSGDLAGRLSRIRLGDGGGSGSSANANASGHKNDSAIPMDASDETMTGEESGVVAPEGFFIDPSSRPRRSEWPTTPPATPPTSLAENAHRAPKISSCPRPSSSAQRDPQIRPLFISSSSGALAPPPRMESSSGNDDDDVDDRLTFHDAAAIEEDMGPASRAAAALRILDQATYGKGDGGVPWETKDGAATPQLSPSADIPHQETFHAGHRDSGLHFREREETPSPKRTFDAYPSKANEPLLAAADEADDDDEAAPSLYAFSPNTHTGALLSRLSRRFVPPHRWHTHGGSALAGFLALLLVTCANYMLGPMRDAAALAVGVSHIPALTLASTVLALGSSVPVGWLFEAPNPLRRRVWKRMGLTRGETQGTSLALFYRVFGFLLLSYALGFKLVDKFGRGRDDDCAGGESASSIGLITTFFLRLFMGAGVPVERILDSLEGQSGGILGMQQILSSTGVIATHLELYANESVPAIFLHACASVIEKFGKVIYVMFFLVVHLMKLHSLSLIWGVTTEAMEYEEAAEKRRAEREGLSRCRSPSLSTAGGPVAVGEGGDGPIEGGWKLNRASSRPSKSSLRLKRLGFVGFGGTLGGILGSVIASFAAQILNLSGLLILAAILLEISANLSIELGRIMQRHWEEQMKYLSCGDLTSLASGDSLASGQHQASVDSSIRKSASLGSMKRIASGSHLSNNNLANLAAASQQKQSGGGMTRAQSIGSIALSSQDKAKMDNNAKINGQGGGADQQQPMIDDNSFKQRLLRGITTILKSRLLMAIFTYNALYASTSVLLSFQRAELVANRSSSESSNSAVSNTAFLAKINTASSVAVFALQASGLGAYIANGCGQRGALALMPIIRLCGVILLGWWHLISGGQPPDLILFLVIDEFTKVINFAIAKPVRENLWRGLSAEARYEAKPIVDTLANRWGGGSAAFLVSFINRITDLTGLGVVNEQNGERSIFGFPPVLLLCMIISAWWTAVSADVGNIRRKIDLELKKQQ